MATQLGVPPISRRSVETQTCPYFGQLLLDREAVSHVHESERDAARQIDQAAKLKAAALAKTLTAKLAADHVRKLERLNDQLASRDRQLSEVKAEHAEQLRKLKVKVRADAKVEAGREAEAKVRTQLRQKDQALKRFQEQIAVQQRQIEHLTADERGDLNEERLLQELRAAFPDDQIERPGRGRAGGDILHEVRVASGARLGKAGLIVYECKDTQAWSNGFIDQACKEGETHGTPYLVIISRAFPRNEKTLFVRNGVAVVDPARAIDLARIMRRMVAEVHRATLTADGQQAKSAELCAYLGSTEFRRAFDAVAGSSDELAGLLGKERKWHEQSWAKRQSIYTDIGSKTAAIDAHIRTIIEKRSPSKSAKVVRLHLSA
jgi:hypothetical protein